MFNYKKVKKQSDNPFLNLYKLDAVDREGKVFDYYFVSRRDERRNQIKNKGQQSGRNSCLCNNR